MKLEVDFYIKCSMLEIYKENLYDLLLGFDGDTASKAVELKIKENPHRGIYVEGLIQTVHISSLVNYLYSHDDHRMCKLLKN